MEEHKLSSLFPLLFIFLSYHKYVFKEASFKPVNSSRVAEGYSPGMVLTKTDECFSSGKGLRVWKELLLPVVVAADL